LRGAQPRGKLPKGRRRGREGGGENNENEAQLVPITKGGKKTHHIETQSETKKWPEKKKDRDQDAAPHKKSPY